MSKEKPSTRDVSLHSRERGMVSIVVTLLMMLVISLIVLGFAQVSRREQRQALDRQLSAQAFFAAESGVNDARKVIKKALSDNAQIPEKTICAPDASYRASPTLDASNNVSYPCLLVATRLKTLSVSPLEASDDSVNLPFEADGVLSTMHVNWTALPQPTNQGQISSGCHKNGTDYFPANNLANWTCPYGVLRMDIVPTDALSRAAMGNGQKTLFMMPDGPGAAAAVDFNNINGSATPIRCLVGSNCNLDITNMPDGNYALRVSAQYVRGGVTVSALDTGGNSLELKNAQVMVDATGKAQDVLRRIQVRLPLAKPAKTPDYAIESASSVCKRFEIAPKLFKIPGDIQGQDQSNPLCRPTSVQPICRANPRDIIMVLDSSGSMRTEWQTVTRMEKMKQVATTLVTNGTVGEQMNHMSVIKFSSEAEMLAPLGFDANALASAIAGITDDDRTNYLTGLDLAYAEFTSTRVRPNVPKVLIFMSDGEPTDDETEIRAKADQFKAAGIEVNTIAISLDSSAYQLLIDMAGPNVPGGGEFIPAEQEAQLDAAIARISNELRCD